MKLCLHDCTSEGWPAGAVVLEAIVHALRQLGADRPHLSLSTWRNKPREFWKALAPLADSIIEFPPGAGNPPVVDAILRDRRVDCFFSIPTATAVTVTLPRICWIFDFQHLHHPQNFSAEERTKRSDLFRRNAETSRIVFVKSKTVEQDFIAFAPNLARKVRRIRFVPHIPTEAWATDEQVLQRYGLPGRFFLMPNQFQPHKNHGNVLEALRLLRDRGCPIPVVCTGSIPESDLPRRDALVALAKKLKVDDLFIILGFVPPLEYFQLMRRSLGLLNPSLFEGFGLSVSEAGYLAGQVIVSDLPVFHEHALPHMFSFNPDDPADMAQRLEEAASRSVAQGQSSPERHAAAQRQFGVEFLSMMKEAVGC